MMTEEFRSFSPADTESIASRVVHSLGNSRVIGLIGELGAGKTVFVKGVAKALGVRALIQSPTFVIMRVYPLTDNAFRTLVHVDCYRLAGSADLTAVGLSDYLDDSSTLTVIEWADKIPELMPSEAVKIHMTAAGPSERRILVVRPEPHSRE